MGKWLGSKGFRSDEAPHLTCARCRESKPIEEFRRLRNGSRASYCTPCQYATQRDWRARNRETINAARRVSPRPGRTAHCPGCDKDFVAPSSRPTQRYCSVLCKNRAYNRKAYDAGSRRRFPPVRGRRRLAIADRDGWRCGLCHAVIDPDLRWPHPGSLSIDHIDPDGAHEPANWQASHLACNVQAGRKGAA